MLIVCPSCASHYSIDPGRIGPAGRKVRCAACRESWFVTLSAPASPEKGRPEGGPDEALGPFRPAAAATAEPAEPVEPPSRAEPAPEPSPVAVIDTSPVAAGSPAGENGLRRRGAPARPRPSTPDRNRPDRLRAGFAAAATLVLALAGAAIPARSALVAAVPGTASLFSALALPVNPTGLEFTRVSSRLSGPAERPVLMVSGEIANRSGRARPVPPLEISVRGEAGETLYAWSAAAARVEVEPGAFVPFEARLTSPPPAGRRVEVSLNGRARPGVVAAR